MAQGRSPGGRLPRTLLLLAFAATTFAAHPSESTGEPEAAASEAETPESAAWDVLLSTVIERELRAQAGEAPPNTFATQLAAHRALVQFRRANPGTSASDDGRTLNTYVALADAGFLEEYVLEAYATPGVTVAADVVTAIDLPAYLAWRERNDVPAAFDIDLQAGDAAPTPTWPGSTLPVPNEVMSSAGGCRGVRDRLAPVLDGWFRTATALSAPPVSMPVALPQLARVFAKATHRTSGLTLVDARAAELLYIAGYCAVDMQAHESAMPLLRAAIDLAPWEAQPKLELAQAHVMAKQYDAADALVEDVLSDATDACTIAIAWRKRGYIRFDQGRFEDALAAYRRSLAYEPDSALAKSEIALLKREIERTGGKAGEDAGAYVPPPGTQTVSQCRPENTRPST